MKKIYFLILSMAVFSLSVLSAECTPDWTCTEWSPCIDGEQIRSCVDLNLCGGDSEKPEEKKDCGVCTPDWQCEEWVPEECPKTKIQTRNCIDSNNCGTSKDRPIETKFCEIETNLAWLFTIIIIIIILLIIVDISLIISATKKPKKTEIKRERKENQEVSKY
ncbi:MAG: hypothetical protein ABH804_02250 [archaeon]